MNATTIPDANGVPIVVDEATDEQIVEAIPQIEQHKRLVSEQLSRAKAEMRRRFEAGELKEPFDEKSYRVGEYRVKLSHKSDWDVSETIAVLELLRDEGKIAAGEWGNVIKRSEPEVAASRADRLLAVLGPEDAVQLRACRTWFVTGVELIPLTPQESP